MGGARSPPSRVRPPAGEQESDGLLLASDWRYFSPRGRLAGGLAVAGALGGAFTAADAVGVALVVADALLEAALLAALGGDAALLESAGFFAATVFLVAVGFALAAVAVAGALGRGRFALVGPPSPLAPLALAAVSAAVPFLPRLAALPVAACLLAPACFPAAPRLPRPNRPAPRSGACSINTRHSSRVRVLGSRSFGILAFFLPLVTYGP
jgi:hypothetical protein